MAKLPLEEHFDKRKKDFESELDDMEEDIKLLEKMREDPTEENIRRAMNVLCFGDIIYCCACSINEEGKPCILRNSFLKALDLGVDWYKGAKEQLSEHLVKAILKKKNREKNNE